MNEKWDKRFLELAKHISTWSKDSSTKVGAVVVKGKDVLGLGFNGFAKGVADHSWRYSNRELKYKFVVHAEVNALIMAGRDKCQGATLYVWPSFSIPPICHDCCKTAIQYGIKEIVGYFPSEEDAERAKRWQESIDLSKIMCNEANVQYRGVERA